MDLIEILKGNIGCQLYSPICGECTLLGIEQDDTCPIRPIRVEANNRNDDIYSFTKEGKYYNNVGGECLLFPSKNNRDWSTFPKHKLKPFDKVLVRDNDNQCWIANLFSNYANGRFVCVSCAWDQCIPFEGNENLLGTSDKPKEE